MNLEDISVVMKLCDDNVLKLHENLRSYQRDVRRVKKLMTKRWANVKRLDKGIIALHDQLVGSLSEVNAYIIKLNLHIELNRPLDRFTEEERSEDSLDELYSLSNASVRAIKGGSSDKTDEQSQEQASIEKSLEDSTQLVPVDLSLRFVESSRSSSQSFDEPKVAIPQSPVLASTSTPKLTRTPSNESLLSPRISNQTISNDTSKQNSKKITELEIKENPMVIESFPEDPKISTQTSNSVSQQKSKNISPLQIEENPVGIKDIQEEQKVAYPTSNKVSPQTSKNRTSLQIKESTEIIKSYEKDPKVASPTSNNVSQQKCKTITSLQIKETPVVIKPFQEEPNFATPTNNIVSQHKSKHITPLQIEGSPENIQSFQEGSKVITPNSNNVFQQKSKNKSPLQKEEIPVVIKPFPEEPKVANPISNKVSPQTSKTLTSLQIKESPGIIKSFQENSKVITPNSNNVSQQKSKNTTSLQIKESTEIIRSFQDDPKVATPTSNDLSNLNSKNITPLQTQKNPAFATLPSTWLIDPPDQVPTAPSTTISKLPKTPRNQTLLAPKGGTQTTSTGIYNQILRNMAAFPSRTLVAAALVHVNLADDCIYVAKWDESSERIQKVLQGQVALQELDQLPDYGEIFAVLDSSDNITTRMTINSSCAVGGYYGYLIDYGEHIHLNGYETIYELPDDIKRLPAEAIRAKLVNYDIGEMKTFLYSVIQLRVLENNGIELVVEVIEDNLSKVRLSLKNKTDSESRAEVSEEDMAMLNEIEESTSDPLKAVLGFRPTDEQRICRHYDPKINGCFKGNNCRLVHEPFAPYGATKDVEVAAPLPETLFDTPVPFEIGSIVRILITFINGPTEVYAQFLDGSAPLVWEEKDVPVNKRHFKHKPHILDIVLALYSDGCFYRAQIIDELDKEYKIFYVDYGNTEFVPLSSLAPCNDVERLKPHRCISCHFEGVVRSTLLTHQETFECVEYLKSKVLNREMNVRLVNRLPDGFMIRFLGDWKEVPRHLINRKYVDPVNGKRRDSDGEED